MFCIKLQKLKKLKENREEAASLFSTGKFRDAKAKYQECLDLLKTFDFKNVSFFVS